MLLVIDVGNTNTVIGIYYQDKLIYDWRLSTDKNKTIDEYGLMFKQLVETSGINIKEIRDIIISSVVPTLMEVLPPMCVKYFHISPMVVGPGVKTGMNILYDNPKEVGADRIVNAVAAYERYGGPAIIVDLGTAISLDILNKRGDYIGGIIAPGIKIAADALFMKTSKLPKVEIKKPKAVIGKTTIAGIQSGLYYGFVGLVDYLIEKIIEEMEEEPKNVKIIATGGFSSFILEESRHITIMDKLLTLDGLKIIYQRNKKE